MASCFSCRVDLAAALVLVAFIVLYSLLVKAIIVFAVFSYDVALVAFVALVALVAASLL